MKIYLACPYSHKNEAIKEKRFELVSVIAARLMMQGHLVFSPISHTHPIAKFGKMKGDWSYWEKYDRTFIEWADELYVLTLPGWRKSVGVTAEIRIAQELRKPVIYKGYIK